MKLRFVPVFIAMTLISTPLAFAAPKESSDPQALASEGMQQLMRAMELMLLSIPQFEAPIVNENGDIIIRRKRPGNAPHRGNDVPQKDGKSI